ncbi:MAG: deoxyguanosinetriphosphate triphosphohydrolase, partial [Oscillospiraceae bacterium]|nr:deoxyguanosinetriphosphate triphosphohydrolase [Oscillospiraceae bacterium]
MTVREELEFQEHRRLNPLAAFSDKSSGRPAPEEPRLDDVRTCYQRDIDRIVHSKAFRRLMHKTQVFLRPEGDHYRTRMTHTLEVSRIAGTITRALGLNEDLAEAIAMGHDLGHTPFGHAGEAALSRCLGKPFRHNEQSLRVVDVLENEGRGLNLTNEVRLGILGHTGSYIPETLEGQVVRRSDQIAYVNHDIDDAIRAGLINQNDLPQDCIRLLGGTHGERIDVMIADMVDYGRQYRAIGMNDDIHEAMMALRAFLFRTVYPRALDEKDTQKVGAVLSALYHYFNRHIDELPEYYKKHIRTESEEAQKQSEARAVCDYIAGMTDNYAVDKYTE